MCVCVCERERERERESQRVRVGRVGRALKLERGVSNVAHAMSSNLEIASDASIMPHIVGVFP